MTDEQTDTTPPVGQAVLRTERLVLRPFRAPEAEAVAEVFADAAMSRYLGADLTDRTVVRAMLDRRLSYAGPAQLGHWVVVHHDVVIGLAHLRPSWELPAELPEIGWYISTRYAGRGFATEAARGLTDHGLTTLGLHSVWALIHVDNTPSLRVAAKLGFLPVGAGIHYEAEHRVHIALPTRDHSAAETGAGTGAGRG